MIREVHIENFKSVADLELPLGRVNVLIGANGCGKTNILEAICLGGAVIADKLDNEFLAPRGIRYSEPQAMRSGFSKEGLEKPIRLRFVEDLGSSLELALGNPSTPFSALEIEERRLIPPPGLASVMDTLPDEHRQSIEKYFSLHQEFASFSKKSNPGSQDYVDDLLIKGLFSEVGSFLIYAPEPVALRRLEDEGRTLPLGIHGDGLFRLLATLTPEQLETVKQSLALIDWFDDFEVTPAALPGERRLRIKDQFLADGLVYFEQRAANEGFLFLLFYLSLFISQYTPAFFAIDNLDNGLNPKLCAHLTSVLVKLAEKHDKQVIITTHNPAVLDGLDLKDDEQRLFVVYRNIDGRTCARRVVPKDLPEGDPPTRLSEAFLRGYIGGLPKNF